jgi:hypothetical protein
MFVAVSISVTEFEPTNTTASVLESGENPDHEPEADLYRAG